MTAISRFWRDTLIASLCVAAPMAAAAQADEEEVPQRHYTVEMIVFLYTENVGTGGEIFVAEATAENAQVFGDTEFTLPDAAAEPPEKVVARRIPFVSMAADDYTMTDIWNHLRRLDVYRPVMRFGWTQAVYPEAETASRPLADFTQPAAGISGDLKLYLGRFLHLVVDLQLAGQSEPVQSRFGTDGGAEGPVYYRISEDRIFKSGDLRYFDHPKFGVLAKITRAEDASSAVVGVQ